MGILKKTTEEINALFDKIDAMPEEGVVGKTPVLTTGNTTTLEAGAQATSNVVNIGIDAEGNPKYRIDFGIPKGADGQDGSSSGGGGVADSVQWSKVLNKPAWVDSPSKPSYTASEVNAIAIGGLKTINGQSIEGEGNIEISGGGSSGGGIEDAPKDGQTYGRNNGSWVVVSNEGGGSGTLEVDISDIYLRLVDAGESGTISQEDYDALFNYADNNTKVTANLQNPYVVVQSIIVTKVGDDIFIHCYMIVVGQSLSITLTYIQKNLSFTSATGTPSKMYKMGEYRKADSYTAITSEDSIQSAIAKLEAAVNALQQQ